jgi:hypothetical protein
LKSARRWSAAPTVRVHHVLGGAAAAWPLLARAQQREHRRAAAGSCSKCGADRYNCVLSRRNWTRAKKRSVKSARSIWSTIRRLDPMKHKNRIAAAKQVNDSRVRHFSRATDFSNAFQNVRGFTRREPRKYSPGGDDIFVPIFAG